MNNLEFIEQHIEETQTSIKAFELDFELFHREGDKRDAEKLKQILKHLLQIKSELEAWKVVKPSINEIKNQRCVVIHNVFRNKYYQIIKKALEEKK